MASTNSVHGGHQPVDAVSTFTNLYEPRAKFVRDLHILGDHLISAALPLKMKGYPSYLGLIWE